MDRDRFRRLDPEADLIPIDRDDHDPDVVADDDRLIDFPREDEHLRYAERFERGADRVVIVLELADGKRAPVPPYEYF